MELWNMTEELIYTLFFLYHGAYWLKEEATAKQKKKQIEKKEYLDKLKSAIIISSIVVALAGAAFAITKKLKEKWSHIAQCSRVLEDS